MQEKGGKNPEESFQDSLNFRSSDLEKLEDSISDILKDARSITNMVNKTISQYQASMPKRAEQARMAQERMANMLPKIDGEAKSFQVKSILKIVFGGIIGGLTVSGLIAGFIVQLVMGTGGMGLIPLLLLAAISAWLVLSGINGVSKVNRFRRYLKKLGNKTYCSFKDLSAAIKKPVSVVKEDIKYMIEKGWFLEGHTDLMETCLITSDETYKQYQATELQRMARQEEENKVTRAKQAVQKSPDESQSKLSPEVREVLKKGNTYLERIRVCNLAIPGEEITEKITKMEQIVDQIFTRAQEHPEIVPDLKRMMDYYLPTSIKLLEAYIDMDAQAYQGENIQKSKKEIEQTIDTLNLAFEKLMDSIFQETAWDVASDISVLNTILAQEGLTENGMMGMH